VQYFCPPCFSLNLSIAVALYMKAFFRFIKFVCCSHQQGLGNQMVHFLSVVSRLVCPTPDHIS
jgi:hypothetical protein